MTTEEKKEEVVRQLAQSHRAVDPDIQEIYWIKAAAGLESDPLEPIKLLEVNSGSTASGIVPVGFPAHVPSGILFPTVVVEIHPTEFEGVRAGTIPLPPGWQFQQSQRIE